MNAILITLMTFAAVSLALYPLFKYARGSSNAPRGIDPALENLLSQREATYSAIKDLEFDRVQGKLSEADYIELRAKYETKAVAVLQQLESAGHTETPDLSHAASAAPVCPKCGTASAPGDRFCRTCGRALAAQCPSCGSSIGEADHFCRKCGSLVLSPAAA